MHSSISSGTSAMLYRERQADKPWTRMFRVEAWIEQKGRCAYCHEPIRRDAATADHDKPRIGGGVTKRENIKAACEPCNRTKGFLTAKQFVAKIKDPQPGDSIHVWLAWSRRRIWLATHRACTRIERFAK